MLDIILGSYQSFKYDASLIEDFYPTYPSDGDQEPPLESESEAKSSLIRSVTEKGSYFYCMQELMMFKVMRLFCSCCAKHKPWYQKRLKRFNRHEDASEALKKELDITRLVKVLRIGEFLAKLILRKHQRALVSNFKKYKMPDLAHLGASNHEKVTKKIEGGFSSLIQVDGDSDTDNGIPESPYCLSQDQRDLLREIKSAFNPEEDGTDLSILYEITGFQGGGVEQEPFWSNYHDFGDKNE